MRSWMLHLSPAECVLASAISDVCEASHFAGWLWEAEFDAWMLLHDPLPEWGIAGPEELRPLLERVGAAATEAGCWVSWPDDADQAHRVGLDEWERRYEKWRIVRAQQ